MPSAAQKKVLTDRALKALKPADAGKRYIVWDAQQPHLGVRVTDRADEEGKAAVRSFIIVKRRPGDRNPITHVIGAYPAVKLADARKKAEEVLKLLGDGRLPSELEREKRVAEQRRRKDTVAVAVEAFIGELKGLRSASESEATLRRQLLGQTSELMKADGKWVKQWSDGSDPVWRDTPIASIKRRDVIARLDEIKRQSGKHAARHALADIRKFFNWCAEGERFGVEVSPCAGIKDKTIGISGKDLKRKRVLSDDELRDVWQAATVSPFGPLVRLLMLTGQRLNDIAAAKRSETDLDKAMLTVPAERFKTGNGHEVPLTPIVIDILLGLPKFKGYWFTTTAGARPISGFSKMKERLDQTIAERRKQDSREAMPHWTLHDLRRTVRTRLVGDCGVDAFIAERVIGHALPGLHAVYDQGSHREPKREALAKWEARLLAIVGPPEPKGENVVVASAP